MISLKDYNDWKKNRVTKLHTKEVVRIKRNLEKELLTINVLEMKNSYEKYCQLVSQIDILNHILNLRETILEE